MESGEPWRWPLQAPARTSSCRTFSLTTGYALSVAADVSDAEQAENLISSAVGHFGRLDILANNTGIGGGRLRLHEVEPDDFD